MKKINSRLLILLGLHLFLLASFSFTAWPEMQLWPYLILKGWLPYRDIAMAHTPALILELSIFNYIFGTGLWQLKAYTWLVILLTDVVLFYIARRLWGIKIAIASVFFYIFIQTFYEGNGLWFDLVLGFYGIALFYLAKRKHFVLAGILWFFAFLTKQSAAWFLIPITIMIVQDQTGWRLNLVIEKMKNFTIGVFVLLIPAVMIIFALGIWPDFWYWAVQFGIGILPRAQGQVSFPELRELLNALLPFSILPFLLFTPKKKEGYQLVIWTVFSALGAYPRWGLFHFQPALPFLAIAAGLVFVNLKRLRPIYKYLLTVYLILSSILFFRFYLREWGKGTRFYEDNILKVTSYIKENTNNGDSIFVVNTWDSLYSMTGTIPASKPWIPHLPWYMELSGIQEGIVGDLGNKRPEIIVVGKYTDSGLSSYKPELIDKFMTENYEVSDKIGDYLILLPRR